MAYDDDIDPSNNHVNQAPLERISDLAPFCALILSIIFVIYFVIRFYILERFLLARLYGQKYTGLDDMSRRGFLNHHIAGATKILILIVAAYPFVNVAFGNATFHSPFAGSTVATQGDVLIVAAQMLLAMYVFELLYRPKISPISVAHHIGTIMVGQSAIGINLNLLRERDGSIEFILCTVWGAFDIVCEFLPHAAMILYRVYPTSHVFLRNTFLACCITTVAGTVFETILTLYLFGSLWQKWTHAFRVITPMLHLLFSAAQLWGSWIFWKLYMRQRNTVREQKLARMDVESGVRTFVGEMSEPVKSIGTAKIKEEGQLSEPLRRWMLRIIARPFCLPFA